MMCIKAAYTTGIWILKLRAPEPNRKQHTTLLISQTDLDRNHVNMAPSGLYWIDGKLITYLKMSNHKTILINTHVPPRKHIARLRSTTWTAAIRMPKYSKVAREEILQLRIRINQNREVHPQCRRKTTLRVSYEDMCFWKEETKQKISSEWTPKWPYNIFKCTSLTVWYAGSQKTRCTTATTQWGRICTLQSTIVLISWTAPERSIPLWMPQMESDDASFVSPVGNQKIDFYVSS